MLNGDFYEENNGCNDYEYYNIERKRSRSRNRERKHRHSSGSVSNLGPTASSLLETNNFLEAEVIRLRNELSCTGIRIRALENELSNGLAIRGNLEKELSVYRASQKKWQEMATKNSQVLKQTEMQLSANKEQVLFLTKRNEVLGKKCQELVEKNRICREEYESFFLAEARHSSDLYIGMERPVILHYRKADALQLVNSMRREVENMQTTADLRLVDFKRMENDLTTARERERMWKVEKVELERKLCAKVFDLYFAYLFFNFDIDVFFKFQGFYLIIFLTKIFALFVFSKLLDSLLTNEKKKIEEQRKRDKAQLEQLQNKLKCEQPGWDSQLGVEAVFRAVESIKREFAGQLEQLNNQITGGRPPRILSAPPSSDMCASASSNSATI
ncbi:hypothetical protein DICVIV_04762 [Dictyocaulus viviparus]|uniref:Uncharacterized protein n=1 Tax=Dictyocaulus viviparus TaxID=29172 RepID=A0A0D8XZ44_DICVI|nr:hypothetical protein DICVIV_04762 [Dictyocaulus viviparus]